MYQTGAFPLVEEYSSPEWADTTAQEARFLTKVLELPQGSCVLDVGCGPGRHSMELARNGFEVTGVDISEKYLESAQKSARAAGLGIHFEKRDMRNLNYSAKFDAAVNLFSSFGHFEDEADDFKTLSSIRKALKPGGKFVLDLFNAEQIKKSLKVCKKANVPYMSWTRQKNGSYILQHPSLIGDHIQNKFVFIENGTQKEFTLYNRIYTLGKIKKLLRQSRFKIQKVYGNIDGSAYHPKRSPRMIVVAQF